MRRERPVLLGGALLLVLIAAVWIRSFTTKYSPVVFYQVTRLIAENYATAAAISLDGGLAAYANSDGIFVRVLPKGIATALRCPENFSVVKLASFADWKALVASGFSTLTNQQGIALISVVGAPPRSLPVQGQNAVPSPDGSRSLL